MHTAKSVDAFESEIAKRTSDPQFRARLEELAESLKRGELTTGKFAAELGLAHHLVAAASVECFLQMHPDACVRVVDPRSPDRERLFFASSPQAIADCVGDILRASPGLRVEVVVPPAPPPTDKEKH